MEWIAETSQTLVVAGSFALSLIILYGEVLGLKWNAVDLVNNTVTIKHTVTAVNGKIHKAAATKNDSSYAVIPLPDFIKAALEKQRSRQTAYRLLQPNDYQDSGYVCTQVNGNVLLPHYVGLHFKLLLKKNNMPAIRFHDLRHSAACYLKHLGFDLKDIQTWLRHKDIQTTMNIYVNLDMVAKNNIADSLNKKFTNFGA